MEVICTFGDVDLIDMRSLVPELVDEIWDSVRNRKTKYADYSLVELLRSYGLRKTRLSLQIGSDGVEDIPDEPSYVMGVFIDDSGRSYGVYVFPRNHKCHGDFEEFRHSIDEDDIDIEDVVIRYTCSGGKILPPKWVRVKVGDVWKAPSGDRRDTVLSDDGLFWSDWKEPEVEEEIDWGSSMYEVADEIYDDDPDDFEWDNYWIDRV